jgi:hypothetical protein
MEERQTKIKAGAGLEESRYNVEFIDFLQKWSTPALMVIAIVVLGMFSYRKYTEYRTGKVERAFGELSASVESSSPNPESLKILAIEFEGIRGVPVMARLAAADEYLRAARLNLRTGAKLEPDGTVPAEELLSPEDRTRYLSEAQQLYQAVLDQNAQDSARLIHAISAAYGLAAVAECKGEADAARRAYERVTQLAERAGFSEHIAAAKKRMDDLATLAAMPKLYVAAELPKPPEPPKPVMPELPGLGLPGATGATGQVPETAPPATGIPPEAATGAPPATGAPAPTGTPEPK